MSPFIHVLSAMFLCTIFWIDSVSFAAETGRDESSLEEKVDQIFAPWNKDDSPGCAVAIFQNGQILYQRGYGMADLESQVPIDKETVFDIGSMSKQFTAACIILLAENATISLNDPITKYFPEFSGNAREITIRHLLHHTSGIRDFMWLMLLARMEFGDMDEEKKKEVIQLLARQKHLYFNPGDDSYYSNSNYILLGAIVERVSGVSLREYAKKHLFDPLGMKNTSFVEKHSQASTKKATGYVRDSKGVYHAKVGGILFAAGGVHSTVGDLAVWNRNFDNSQIGGPDFITTMETQGKLNNGQSAPFACGLEVKDHRGIKAIGHKGFTENFSTYMVRFPEKNFSIICLGNTEVHPDRLAMKAADIYLASELKPLPPRPPRPEPAQRTVAQVDPEIYDNYVGGYRFDFGLMMAFEREEDRLLMKADKQPSVELFPESETEFFMKEADIQVQFKKEDSGKVTGMTMIQRGNAMQAKRVGETAAISPERLAGYVGEYYNDELTVTYTVGIKDGQLFVKAPRNFESSMRNVENDKFATSRGDMNFQRNEQGEITSYQLDVKTERLRFTFMKK